MNTPEESAFTIEDPQAPLTSASRSPAAPPVAEGFHANNPPWGVWQALLTWALSVLLLLFLPLLLSLPYLAYRYRDVTPTREALLEDKTFLFISVASYLPIHLLTFIMAWYVVTQLGKFDFWRNIGWRWPAKMGFWKSAGLAILLFLAGTALVVAFPGPETDVERILQSSRPTAYMLAFVAFATAPLVEETIYRGVLYAPLQRAMGMTPAIIAVASLFAAGHVYQYRQNFGVISAIVLLSVALTVVRARTGSLLPCFVIHLIFNGIQSVQIILAPYIRALAPAGEQKAVSLILFLRALSGIV